MTVSREAFGVAALMNSIVRYSPTVQDVSITDAHGMTLVSTDPDAVNQPASFLSDRSLVQQGLDVIIVT